MRIFKKIFSEWPDTLYIRLHFKNGTKQTISIGCSDATKYFDELRRSFVKWDDMHTAKVWVRCDEVIFFERV